MSEYGFTNADALNTEEKQLLTSLLNDDQKGYRKRKVQSQQNSVKLYGIVWGKFSPALQYEAMIKRQVPEDG